MNTLTVHPFQVEDSASGLKVEALCIDCGDDLVVVVGGGERYHIGATALSISLPSLKNPEILTNSTYLVPVPGHKEEDLARRGSLHLSRTLRRNVVITVGIHRDQITRQQIELYVNLFDRLMDTIAVAYENTTGTL